MPVEHVSKKGKKAVFGLDLEAVMAYEESHPEWSLINAISGLSASIRFSNLNLLVRFLGSESYIQWVEDGWTMEDLADIYTLILQSDLGFPSSGSSGPTPEE